MALGDVIARLSVSLGLDTVAFERGSTLAEKRMAQMQRKFDQLGKRIGNLGKTLSIGLTAPLTAFGVSAFNVASDAAELQSAFDQTFGDMADSMNEWAVATGDAMGRSTQELQRAANTFGIFFNQAAPTREEAAKMSQVFTVLAQDLASFYNVSESDALQKLRSGLSGESEPLRDFGVFLSEAQVKAKGLEMGLGGLSGELSEQEKIMARYQLILESTANAQGDVARTSDGTANKMREAKAAFEELQVVVGTKLLPMVTPLIEKLAAMIEWFTQLPAPVQEGALIVGGLAAALGPVLIVVGQLTTAIPLLSKALMFLFANPIILGAAAVIAGIYLAWKNWDKITAIVQRLYQGVKTWLMDKLGAVLNWVKSKVEMVEGAFRWLWDRVVGNSWVPDMVDAIGQHMRRLDKEMVDPATEATRSAEQKFRDMAGNVRSILDRLFPEVTRLMAYQDDLRVLEGSNLGAAEKEVAMKRLRREFAGLPLDRSPTVGVRVQDPGPIGAAADIEKSIENVVSALPELARKGRETTVRIAKSFKDMADEALQSLSRMVNAIKGGGFLDILNSVVGFGLQLGSMGVFGKTIAKNINASVDRGYATGTSSAARGLAWVGERGPELVNFRGGERVWNNRDSMAMGRGKLQVEVVANNNGFGAIIRDEAGGVVAQAAPAIASAGSAGAQMSLARSRKRSMA